MEKILTIVVPTYNMEKYLDKCLTSLIVLEKDLMEQLEVLVVNDGSKDRSSEIAHSYQDRYPQTFRVIDKENGNYGSCVNRGLDEAKGFFFRILDADDWFNTDSFSEFLFRLKNCTSDLAITTFSFRYTDGRIKRVTMPKDVEEGIVYDARQFVFDEHEIDFLANMHAMTYRTEVLRTIGLRLQTGISYTDTEYCFFPLDYIKNLVFWDLNLYQYLNGREGQTFAADVKLKSVEDMAKVALRMVDYYKEAESKNNDVVLANQRLALAHILILFYFTILPNCKKTPKIEALLRKVDETIVGTAIDNRISLGWDRGWNYIRGWRKYGLYGTSKRVRLWQWLHTIKKKIVGR